MTSEQLKASILQYAIQGKLVEQRPEEGTVEDLYQQIQEEKQKLIKEGKIKKEKPLAEITEEEIPFEIPETWKWVRLGDIYWYIDAGKSPNCEKSPVTGKRWGVITTTAVQMGFFDDVQNKILPENFDVKTSMQVRIGDILITRAGPMNRTGIACKVDNIRYNLILSDKTLRINMSDEYICKDYVVMLLNSPQIRNLLIERMSGMDKQQVNISQDKYKTVLLPLPPLKEQHRIVAKIEELMPYVDRYAKAYEKLEQFNAKFPEDMKKSILQYAIQGKLVEQRAEEGTAEELYLQIQDEKQRLIQEGKIKKEKPLEDITEDEIPFDIPVSWKWDRLGNLLIIERGGSPRPIKDFITTDDNGINWIKIGDTEKGSKYINSCAEKIIPEGVKKSRYVEKGDFILSNSMSFGRPYILNIDGCIHDGWLVLRQPVKIFDKDYLYYLLSSPMVFYQFCGRVAGAVVNNLNSDKVALTLVPIPPLEEQKRIVAKIEELMPYCDRLLDRRDSYEK